MSDVFSEVDEQVRSARVRSALGKAWPFALGVLALALLVILAVWGWRRYQASQAEQASDSYTRGLEALGRADVKTAEVRFAQVAASAAPAYKALGLMQQAGLRLNDHKDDQAVALLDQAAKAAPTDVLRDSAALKAALILIDRRPLAEVQTRLTPLTEVKHPFRWLAREALGMARLQAGQTAAAHADFAVLSLAQDVDDATRARARAAMSLIDDGAAKALPALVKAAAVLPPAPTPPAAVQPATPGAAQ